MNFESFVLAAATADLEDEPAAREHADAVELRMDLAADPLAPLDAYDGELPLLVTNRVEWEGGEAPDSQERLDTLETALEHPEVEAVDVELDAVRDGDAGRVVESARDRGVSVVVSVHDFEGTPTQERMESLLAMAADRGDVGKLAVTAESPGDVLALLAATWSETENGSRVATMAMGEAGRHSRAVAPLYGSRIGYAPVDPAEATAPGQFDLATLTELIERLDSGPPETSDQRGERDTTF
jgi:3-dehydroquinate dehydratase-1